MERDEVVKDRLGLMGKGWRRMKGEGMEKGKGIKREGMERDEVDFSRTHFQRPPTSPPVPTTPPPTHTPTPLTSNTHSSSNPTQHLLPDSFQAKITSSTH
ncbi:hypothetical protein Pcinc_029477 [Petrolisthes cinctipes]|uniref:Uncharacterized protein n=1 Tax=Petrolisthes cinctipes TaxID=88211 RepID=A0AAE1EZZ9_PETCI|nr:hypothetical protein Pcinc_029477 [Petrolisthes cinctipes]